MHDVTEIIEGYFAAWNETDPGRRRELVGQTWTSDASYVDPVLAGDGPDGIDVMIAAAQAQFPGHRLRLAGPIDQHHDRLRFNWEMVGPNGDGPVVAGIDFAQVADDGRLRSITGFIDLMPAS